MCSRSSFACRRVGPASLDVGGDRPLDLLVDRHLVDTGDCLESFGLVRRQAQGAGLDRHWRPPIAGRLPHDTTVPRCALVVNQPERPNNAAGERYRSTCGKVERFHQTLKRYLARQPPADSLPILQLQLDAFRAYYNTERPHQARRGQTPAVAFGARLKARPAVDRTRAHFRVRSDRVSKAGNVTVRYLSRLRHIGLGRAHVGRPVKLLIADDYVRIVAEDGSLLRELVLDAGRDYQPRLHLSTMS
jgi:hypothetical protein